MAEGERMGTVTPLDSIFTSEEAEKAARQVVDAIVDRQKELHCLRDFIADNSDLIHKVKKLPDELSHDIMVPFGGAAFFHGRLVHTNEFMVLLGDGYYAERSAKQTTEILQRRGKSLEAHLESLKRIIKDLDAEAKFFESTAAEIDEGLVEIREEYVEDIQHKESEKGSIISDEKNEDAKLRTQLYELGKEVEEGVSDLGEDEDDETTRSSDVDVNGEDEDDEDEDDAEDEDEDEDEEEDAEEDGEEEDEDEDEDEDVSDIAENISESVDKVFGSKLRISSGGSSGSIIKLNNPPLPLETKVYLQKSTPSNIQSSSERIPSQMLTRGPPVLKAFTGTVIEHSHGLSSGPTNDSTSIQQPSRPVSRFKMQKGNR